LVGLLKQLVEESLKQIEAYKDNSAEKLDKETSLKIFAALNGVKDEDFKEAHKWKVNNIELTPLGLMEYHNFKMPSFFSKNKSN